VLILKVITKQSNDLFCYLIVTLTFFEMELKKRYLVLVIHFLSFFCDAQLSLNQSFNEPVVGDVFKKALLDSVNTVPKSSGTNQLWDFSMFNVNTNLETTTYTTVPSVPYGPTYSGSTYVESNGLGEYTFFKSSFYKLEVVGIQTPDVRLNFSNDKAIAFMYPISMGYSKSDAFSGTAVANSMNGSVNGNVTVVGSGTGSLVIPGGITFTDVLQVKTTQNAIASFAFGLVTVNFKEVNYSYCHASQKFPILVVSYQIVSGAATSSTVKIKLNNSVLVGIEEIELEKYLTVFPNPVKDDVNVKLYNATNENSTLELINSAGQSVQFYDLGNNVEISKNISMSNLESGLYLIKAKLGNRVSIRKIVKE
jgi:hypothetical protein